MIYDTKDICSDITKTLSCRSMIDIESDQMTKTRLLLKVNGCNPALTYRCIL